MSASAKFFLTKEKKEKKKEQPLHGDNTMLCKSFWPKKKTHDCFREWDWEGVEEEFCED